MSILDLFDGGFRQRNKDHFAAIVRVAMEDGVISDNEKTFLDRLAQNLEVSDDEYKKILKDYNTHPINPPTSYDRRLERLFDLARMVHVDHIKDEDETRLLRKIAVGLGFSHANVKYIVDKALTLIHHGVDYDTFVYEMRHMNQ